MQYVDKVRGYAKDMPIDEAVDRAVDECIEQGILSEFLRQNKAEVVETCRQNGEYRGVPKEPVKRRLFTPLLYRF